VGVKTEIIFSSCSLTTAYYYYINKKTNIESAGETEEKSKNYEQLFYLKRTFEIIKIRLLRKLGTSNLMLMAHEPHQLWMKQTVNQRPVEYLKSELRKAKNPALFSCSRSQKQVDNAR
jgi:hypothetical protein